jgi:hypothetical protein
MSAPLNDFAGAPPAGTLSPLAPLAPRAPSPAGSGANGTNGDIRSASTVGADALIRQAGEVVRVLSAAKEAGIVLAVNGTELRLRGDRRPASELLDRVRQHKAELIEQLRGERCRRCGERMAWPGPAGVVYADGTAEHHACRIWAAADRALNSPDALEDEADVRLRGEIA